MNYEFLKVTFWVTFYAKSHLNKVTFENLYTFLLHKNTYFR